MAMRLIVAQLLKNRYKWIIMGFKVGKCSNILGHNKAFLINMQIP